MQQDSCVYEPDVEHASEAGDGCLASRLILGGAFPWEASLLALSDMDNAQSWTIMPSLTEIQAAIREIGDPANVVISIYFRNPYVLDEDSGVLEAGAILATYGVSDRAQFDVITDASQPRGRLPFVLPVSRTAILEQHPDAPGHGETKDGALYPFGFGLAY